MATQLNIYDSLRQDHQMVLQTLDQMVATSAADVSMRTQLLNSFKIDFLGHSRAEEKMLYPKLEQHKSSHDLALESEEEHHAAQSLLHELERTDVRDDRWKAKASVLREMLRHHIQEEENSVFPKAQQLFSEDQAMELARQFEDQKLQEQHRI